nr:patatin-like phospholipase family protein [bacterium]
MGITIVQKSDLARPAKGSRALILAGGAVTGGSFMAGGVKAFNDYLEGFGVNDFDLFVGISSGSMIAAALMGGISPESVLKSLDGTSGHFTPLTALHYYRPNFSELVSRPLRFMASLAGWLPGRIASIAERYPEWSHGLIGAAWRFLTYPSLATYEEMMGPISAAAGSGFPSLMGLLPSGVFDNSPIEGYFRQNIERNNLTNDFREAMKLTGKRLYISAMRLDGARRVIFGPDEDGSLTISQAIQASTALPGFYKPAHIDGVDYVDGGVQETADIDVAVAKGSTLIVCLNPFRPYEAGEFVEGFSRSRAAGRRLAAEGWMAVMNQILRAVLHSRLKVVLEGFRTSPSFKGDIILIEPRADDRAFFVLNPLSLRNRIEAARMG